MSSQDVFRSAKCSRVNNPNSTLCLIKPHIIKSQQTGDLLKKIIENPLFSISALYSVHLTTPIAEELLEVYRGIVPNYTQSIEQICSSPLLAVLITNPGDEVDVVLAFREFTGPLNPALAKVVRPESLRAVFGSDVIRNAVHCTDLSEDGEMECQYIFETVASL